MKKIGILGAGKLGLAIARGLVRAQAFEASQIVLHRRDAQALLALEKEGFATSASPEALFNDTDLVLFCVLPQQLPRLLENLSLKDAVSNYKGLLVSTITGVELDFLQAAFPTQGTWLRAMPNTAIAVGQSMTCICAPKNTNSEAITQVQALFEHVGKCLCIDEKQMQAATALCACGIAFFLRAVRAASQGGIEIGFHAEEALAMAAQTALGASSLLREGHHPEHEIDQVTSPQGCTITGLNQMEHHGFSSALIRGIVSSAQKAGELFK